jgi:hypothetical protein
MKQAGCALTSLAMILSHFGLEVDPRKINKTNLELNLWVCGEGSKHGFACNIIEELAPGQFECKATFDFNEVVEALKNKKIVLFGGRGRPPYLGMDSNVSTHYIVLTKLEKAWDEEIIYFNDPGSGKQPCGFLPKETFEKSMFKAYIIGKK